jgi:hypothetical protein
MVNKSEIYKDYVPSSSMNFVSSYQTESYKAPEISYDFKPTTFQVEKDFKIDYEKDYKFDFNTDFKTSEFKSTEYKMPEFKMEEFTKQNEVMYEQIESKVTGDYTLPKFDFDEKVVTKEIVSSGNITVDHQSKNFAYLNEQTKQIESLYSQMSSQESKYMSQIS